MILDPGMLASHPTIAAFLNITINNRSYHSALWPSLSIASVCNLIPRINQWTEPAQPKLLWTTPSE
jgi:hypothetical protein